MANISTLSEEQAIAELTKLIEDSNDLPDINTIIDYIVSQYSNSNAKKMLTTPATPYYVMNEIIARCGQMIAGSVKKSASKMLFTQSQGDDLSIAAYNFGHQRIEAKASQMTAQVMSSKDISIDIGTSFTDGAGTIWTALKTTEVKKETSTTIDLICNQKGVINYISPISPNNPIAGLTSIEVNSSSIVVGREQESDTELKQTINQGFLIAGTDDVCRRELLGLNMVNSVFVATNADTQPKQMQSVEVASRSRYVSIRFSNPNITNDEANLVAQTISNNTYYGTLSNRPNDNKVRYYFGVSEEDLKKPVAQGGVGIEEVSEDSINCVVRFLREYGNYNDVFFSIAQPTYIDVLINITYLGNYSNTEKENFNGNIKRLVAQIVAESAQVGARITTSSISEKILSQSNDLKDKVQVLSILLKKHDNPTTSQYLTAKSFEYFEVYSTPETPYSGVVITES